MAKRNRQFADQVSQQVTSLLTARADIPSLPRDVLLLALARYRNGKLPAGQGRIGARDVADHLRRTMADAEILTGEARSLGKAGNASGVTIYSAKPVEESDRVYLGGEAGFEGSGFGKVLSPARRRAGIKHVVETLGVSERFACRVIGQHRTTQRLVPKTTDDEAALTADIVELARQYGRYGYRRITALLHQAGEAALKVPATHSVAGRAAEGGPLTRNAWRAFGAQKGLRFWDT